MTSIIIILSSQVLLWLQKRYHSRKPPHGTLVLIFWPLLWREISALERTKLHFVLLGVACRLCILSYLILQPEHVHRYRHRENSSQKRKFQWLCYMDGPRSARERNVAREKQVIQRIIWIRECIYHKLKKFMAIRD